MEITKEIYTAHQKLSSCSVKFLDFVKDNPGSLVRSNYKALLSGRDRKFNYFTSQPWPTFINEKLKNEVKMAAGTIQDLIKSMLDRWFGYDVHKISRYYELPVYMSQAWLYGVDNDYIKNLLGRGDFIFSPGAGLKY